MEINFFTPIKYERDSFCNKIFETSDFYFYLGGKKATIINKDIVKIHSENLTLINMAIKIASYFTIVLPLIFLTIKLLHRTFHSFKEIPVSLSNISALEANEKEDFATLKEIPVSLSNISALEAKQQHEKEDFVTLKEIMQKFYSRPDPFARQPLKAIITWARKRIYAEIERIIKVEPEKLSQLDIDISPHEMRALYDRYGIIVLRKLKHDKLIVCCGNDPVYSSCTRYDYRKSKTAPLERAIHIHENKDSCDLDVLMNPSFIGMWLEKGVVDYVSTYRSEKYHSIKSEGGISLAIDNAGTFRNFKDLSCLLKRGGILKEDMNFASSTPKKKRKFDQLCSQFGFISKSWNYIETANKNLASGKIKLSMKHF